MLAGSIFILGVTEKGEGIELFRSRKMNRKGFILALLSGVIGMASIVMIAASYKRPHEVVGYINGDAVSVDFFKVQLMNEAANSFQYFHDKYGAMDSENFWTNSLGKEVPIEYAKQKTMGNIAAIMVQLQLAKENGLLTDTSYEAFIGSLKEENKRRKESIETGKVIYGPIQYSENEYFNYLLSNLIIKLKEKLQETEFLLPEEKLKQMYKKDKGNFKFRNKNVEKISIPMDETDSKMMIEEIQKRVNEGEDFSKVVGSYGSSFKMEALLFDNQATRLDYEATGISREIAMDLDKGQISEVYEEKEAYCLIKIIDSTKAELPSYEDRVDEMKKRHTEQLYEQLVNQRIQEAQVELKQEVYDSIKIR